MFQTRPNIAETMAKKLKGERKQKQVQAVDITGRNLIIYTSRRYRLEAQDRWFSAIRPGFESP
jgi:hypothetical protein